MIGETLNYENLKAIHSAMKKIAQIDRSQYFENYFNEVIQRMNVHERAKVFKKQ